MKMSYSEMATSFGTDWLSELYSDGYAVSVDSSMVFVDRCDCGSHKLNGFIFYIYEDQPVNVSVIPDLPHSSSLPGRLFYSNRFGRITYSSMIRESLKNWYDTGINPESHTNFIYSISELFEEVDRDLVEYERAVSVYNYFCSSKGKWVDLNGATGQKVMDSNSVEYRTYCNNVITFNKNFETYVIKVMSKTIEKYRVFVKDLQDDYDSVESDADDFLTFSPQYGFYVLEPYSSEQIDYDMSTSPVSVYAATFRSWLSSQVTELAVKAVKD